MEGDEGRITGKDGRIPLEKLKNRIEQIKKKRGGYREILDFYQKVKDAQNKIKRSLRIDPITLKKEWKELLAKEGFSLVQKEDFPLDIEASVKLFETLCQIGKEANPHMAEQMRKLKQALRSKNIDLRSFFEHGIKEQKIDQAADALGLDKKIFSFLIQSSTKPSMEAGMEQLRSEVDPESWLKGYCPICGSLPFMSLLKEEVGKRYLLCSVCSYEWRIDRIFCPFCNNKDQGSLHYFYAEGEETHRVDLCDRCHRYIKTIDNRNLEASDPVLEDLATFHLDLLAVQKGYHRPVPSPYVI